MSAAALVALALPMLATYLLLRPARRAGLSPVAALALAIGIGPGLSSCAFFLALLLFDGRLAGIVGIDAVLLLAALVVWRRAGSASSATRAPLSASERILAVAVLAAALAAAISFYANVLDFPHGRWDAWATWNLRARQLVDAGPEWRAVFPKPTLHGDYPLLIPATVARLWVYTGAKPPVVAAIVAATYATALVLLLYAALAALRGRAQGLVGALCLLGTPVFLRVAPWQYADIPLAFNLLAVLALLAFYDRDPARGRVMLVWAGVAAALMTWTKNEGIMLVVGILAVRGLWPLVGRAPDLRAAAAFAAGLLPTGVAPFYFKEVLAPRSPHLDKQLKTVMEQLADPSRYGVIFANGAAELARGMGAVLVALVVYGLLLGRTPDGRVRAMASSVAAMLVFAVVGFVFTYLTARSELTWLVTHSIDRLELQLWPSALLAILLYVASPSERAAAAPRVAVPARPPAAGSRRGRKRAGRR